VEVIAGPPFKVGLPHAPPPGFEAEASVELERVLQTDIKVVVPTGKVFRTTVGSFLNGNKRAGLAGGAGFGWGIGGHKVTANDIEFKRLLLSLNQNSDAVAFFTSHDLSHEE